MSTETKITLTCHECDQSATIDYVDVVSIFDQKESGGGWAKWTDGTHTCSLECTHKRVWKFFLSNGGLMGM